ncbi:protein translocase subunit SecD [Asanoa sp. WMMD1127]|uniref:protein translocase subunit SecD n=1 Tax=Asanoa sp. WMMD1127 TaxID=3016107 RepID=UPI0024178CA9|nr:protein translocase subunit SecD [Asanoa sp. WMMD1127]MDG4824406.1 protein translocase subunit SecD [Asanoa sp. WMMD1127]
MAPPQRQMHPGRQLAVLAGLFVILYALVFFAGASGSVQDRLHPKLGLDLVGGTRMTLQATTEGNRPPSAESLDQARDIIEQRVNARGVAEAEVVTEGNRNIVVSLPGENADLSGIAQTAELRFRKVLNVTNGTGPAPAPSASATPAPGGTPNPSGSPSAPPAATGQPSATATPGTGGTGGGAEAPATPTPTPTATAPAANPTPAPSGSAAPAPVPADVEAARKAVEAKVGPAAWAAASALQAPDPGTDPTVAETLKPFGQLSPTEVAVLTPQMQFNVPTITCDQLDKRPAGSISKTDQQAIACEAGGKYLLDVAKVAGTDVGNATAQLDQQGQWVVSLDFKGGGQEKWTALTREAYQNSGQTCDQSTLENGNCRVAVVLDNKVISSPEIQGVLTGDSQISGSFDANSADELAGQLRYGALPLTFTAANQENLSPTLGAEYLRAGLIAAGIGLLLVAIYAFFYYRLLGTVIVLSLVLSAGLVFGALVFLGRQIGFTLTLAGIAGFIVSLGVAADSFVIYFERLKDEIREGRSPRSAVPRAWARARRTIISANAISIMAAVVLYIVSVGTVKGFAFALGLATILDLVVVFLFRHPIMTMFANTKAFLSPRVSGLGRILEQHEDDGDEPRNPRTRSPRRPKEA